MHFDHPKEIKRIIVVGLGGTGSQWARSIARILYDMRDRHLTIPQLTFIDPDAVEMKNVGRQMFTAADVGKSKAEVLARRFNSALGLDINWRAEPFNALRDIEDHSWTSRTTLLCGAVDNHKARRELAKKPDAIWIDAGNHFQTGQVVIGNIGSWHTVRDSLADTAKKKKAEIHYLPHASLLFPDLLKPPAPDAKDLSCADLVRFGEQHLLINEMVAGIAANYVFKLMYRLPISSFITYVDLDGLNVKSVPITAEALLAYRPTEEAKAG